jgi:hypothetical protein
MNIGKLMRLRDYDELRPLDFRTVVFVYKKVGVNLPKEIDSICAKDLCLVIGSGQYHYKLLTPNGRIGFVHMEHLVLVK